MSAHQATQIFSPATAEFESWEGPAKGYDANDYIYGENGPWPGQNPILPGVLPAKIKSVPKEQTKEFKLKVLAHYLKVVKRDRPKFAFRLLFEKEYLDKVDDASFAEMFFYGVFSTWLNPDLNAQDKEDFSEFITGADRFDEPVYFKVDYVAMDRTLPIPGVHTAPTVTIFRRTSNTAGQVIAIKINGLVLMPDDGDAWELAKHFVLQGALVLTNFVRHTRIHFPMAIINAISCTALPVSHLLYKIISQHTSIHLAIDRRVCFQADSVAHNNQFLPYTPYPGFGNVPPVEDGMGFPGYLLAAFSGIEGHSSYPAYRFSLEPEKIWTDFNDFLGAYYSCILEFVSAIVSNIKIGDPIVKYWASAIAAWLPGFPCGEQIFNESTLARAVTYYIWTVTVVHSADHITISKYPRDMMSLRLRVPAPQSKTIPPFNRRKLTTFNDTLRYRLASKMFLGPPITVSRLQDTWYHFKEPKLDQINQLFLDGLKDVDRHLPGRRFLPLEDIARSINF